MNTPQNCTHRWVRFVLRATKHRPVAVVEHRCMVCGSITTEDVKAAVL